MYEAQLVDREAKRQVEITKTREIGMSLDFAHNSIPTWTLRTIRQIRLRSKRVVIRLREDGILILQGIIHVFCV
jgi:hypothetical protein